MRSRCPQVMLALTMAVTRQILKGENAMKILFHDCNTDNSYVASSRTDCKDSVDSSLWDMHERIPSRVWTTGKMIAECIDIRRG